MVLGILARRGHPRVLLAGFLQLRRTQRRAKKVGPRSCVPPDMCVCVKIRVRSPKWASLSISVNLSGVKPKPHSEFGVKMPQEVASQHKVLPVIMLVFQSKELEEIPGEELQPWLRVFH